MVDQVYDICTIIISKALQSIQVLLTVSYFEFVSNI